MEFKQLEAFIQVARHKSFSKAAEKIYLSQPTISNHISSLEKQLDTQLFDRSSKEVRLTSAGLMFFEHANNLVNLKNDAISDISKYNNTVSGELLISASSAPSSELVPMLITKFNNNNSNLRFVVNENNSSTVVKDILSFNTDIGFIGKSVVHDKLDCYKIGSDNLVVVSHASFNLPDEISLNDLLRYKFVLRSSSSATRKVFENTLIKKDLLKNLHLICEVDSTTCLMQLITNGLGISVVSNHMYENHLKHLNIKKTIVSDFDCERPLYMIINKKRTLPPVAKAFFEFCGDRIIED